MSHEVCRHKWMMLWESDDGNPFADMTPNIGTMVVPLTETGEILILTEFSPAYNQRILFLPGGSIEEGEDPVESANRELQEEAGFKAGRMDSLGDVYPFIKFLRARFSIYLGRDLQPSKLQGDEGWEITVERIRLEEIESLITEGRLRDSSVIAALYMARAFLQKEQDQRAPQD